MARIRTIKPEFWTSEQVTDCSPLARLLFIGMWNYCDDAGNHTASAKTLKAEVFPSDDMTSASVQLLIDELVANGLVALYSAQGKDYLHVTGWKRHQKIDKPTYKHPPFIESATPPRRTFGESSTTEGNGEEGNGMEGNGKEGNGEQQAGDGSTTLGRICIGLRAIGVQVNPHHPQVQELVHQGLSAETVIAAGEEAVRSKPNERIGIGLVAAILESWAKKAKAMNVAGARPPPAQSSTSSRDASRAAAANSIGLGARNHDPEPDTFDATTGQRVD